MLYSLGIKRTAVLVAAAAFALAGDAGLPLGVEARGKLLVAAVRAGDNQKMVELLNGGANPNTKDDAGTPVLMLSAIYGSAATMQTLLERGVDPNATNAAGASALHYASVDGAKVKLLVAKGANVNARSGPGRTPLIVAAGVDGNFDAVKLLVEKGADVNAQDKLEGFTPTGGGGTTPLIEASKTRDLRMVRYLLDHGAKATTEDHLGSTALHEASLRGSVEIAKLLLDRGADPNHHMKPPYGLTPLVNAAIRGSLPMAELLLAKGAKVNDTDGLGDTPLMWASYADFVNTSLVARLLEAGADVGLKNKLGESAMTWAARRGETPVTVLLRGAGGTSDQPAPVAAASLVKTSGNAMPEVRDAIARSLAVLDKGGPQFFKVSGCISCHNQTLPLMAGVLARTKGIEPNEAIEKQQFKSVLAIIKPAQEVLAEGSDVVPDFPVTGPYILQAMSALKYQADDITTASVHNIAARQLKDGSWIGWSPRPPIENGDIQATALGVYALRTYGVAGRQSEFESRIEQARRWLRQAKPATTEEKVMRLAGLAWAGASREDIGVAAQALLDDQRPDGGWGQLASLPTDAYATGKVLVTLHEAAKLSASSPVYRSGVGFLLRSQNEDGSWLVKTRAFPFQPLKDSGFPHGRDQWISAAGTSWAAMALSYAADPVAVASR